MGILRIYLFGKFQVCHLEDLQSGFEARRVQELFSYLLLRNKRPHPRETLAGLLWENKSTSQAKKYLRQALWQLQNALDACPYDASEPLLLVDGEWIQINPAAEFWLDVTQFETAFDAVRGLRGRDLSSQQREALQGTVHLYQDDLLQGWYHDWCLYRREHLQNMYLALLDKLMGYCEAHLLYEDGIQHGRNILTLDRARERTHRRLMRLHYLAGDRTAALRQYAHCRSALQTELDVAPAHSTQALYQQIRSDQLDPAPPPAAVGKAASENPHPPSSPLMQALHRLQNLQILLADVQHQVAREIQSIERNLRK